MRHLIRIIRIGLVGLAMLAGNAAQATYWNLFNSEGESSLSARYVTYSTLDDMLNDTNRLGSFFPNALGLGGNIVGTGSNGSTYWSLFNAEGESSLSARYVTYGTLDDMLNDTNRLDSFFPNALGLGGNVVGGGSNGSTYWNLFNSEGESSLSARYVTYGTLDDMLNDTNRLGSYFPNSLGLGGNIVGTGSNGSTYWSLFNAEGESSLSARYVTYGALDDMLTDTNRLDSFFPNALGLGGNVVDSGSDSITTVPEPSSWALLTVGFALVGWQMRRRKVEGFAHATR